MSLVENTISSDEIATAQFVCDLPKYKGVLFVIDDAGAPLSKVVEKYGFFDRNSDGHPWLRYTGNDIKIFLSQILVKPVDRKFVDLWFQEFEKMYKEMRIITEEAA